MDKAAQAFDQPHMEQAEQMAKDNLTVEQIWNAMLDSFLANPDGALKQIPRQLDA